jgi:site-specific recombinase XerD
MSDLITLPSGELATLDSELETARGLALEEIAASTRDCYRRDGRLFAAWCAARNLPPVPATAATLAAYLAHLVDSGVRPATISRRLAAIAYMHRIAGEVSAVASPAVRAVLRGARRRLGAAAVGKKAAIDDAMLVAMLCVIPDTLAGKRDRALLSLGWAAALRRSELVALEVADIEPAPGGIRLHIRRSKTDQEGRGQVIGIPDGGTRIQPLAALRAWLAASGIASGPIFRRVLKGRGGLGEQLHPGSVADLVKRYARLAGYDIGALAGHSLRSGLITAAASTGASVTQIANVSRHRSADTLLGYVRTANLIGEYPAADLL